MRESNLQAFSRFCSVFKQIISKKDSFGNVTFYFINEMRKLKKSDLHHSCYIDFPKTKVYKYEETNVLLQQEFTNTHTFSEYKHT